MPAQPRHYFLDGQLVLREGQRRPVRFVVAHREDTGRWYLYQAEGGPRYANGSRMYLAFIFPQAVRKARTAWYKQKLLSERGARAALLPREALLTALEVLGAFDVRPPVVEEEAPPMQGTYRERFERRMRGTFQGLLAGWDNDYSPAQEAMLPGRYAAEVSEVRRVKRTGLYFGYKPRFVLVKDLDDVKVNPWHAGRLRQAIKGYQQGVQMLPITVGSDFDGRRVLVDGNHRLAAARQLGIKKIWATFPDEDEKQGKP